MFGNLYKELNLLIMSFKSKFVFKFHIENSIKKSRQLPGWRSIYCNVLINMQLLFWRGKHGILSRNVMMIQRRPRERKPPLQFETINQFIDRWPTLIRYRPPRRPFRRSPRHRPPRRHTVDTNQSITQ